MAVLKTCKVVDMMVISYLKITTNYKAVGIGGKEHITTKENEEEYKKRKTHEEK